MAINNFNDNWGPYTHPDVENAIKAKIAELETLIRQGVADGSIGLDQLSSQIQTLLSKANTALQSQEQANWNESSSSSPAFIKNKPAVVNDLNQANSGGVLDARQGKALKDLIDGLQATLNTITEDGNVQNAIDTFNEVVAFLNGINNTDTLANALLNKVDKVTGKGLSTEDYTTAEKTKLGALPTNSELTTALGGKQATLVSGTNIKTINNNSLLGEGNITIEAEDGVGFDTISTPATPDGTVLITLTNGNTITLDLNHTHPAYTVKRTVESNTNASVTLSADVIYNLGTVSGNKTISLPSTVDAAAEYEFRLTYSSGTITLPSGVTVANNATLTFTAGKTYQVIISGGILYFSETTVS